MPDQELVDALIAAYRELNHKIRGAGVQHEVVSHEQLIAGHDSVAGILFRMRNRELNASQGIKQMLLGLESNQNENEEAALTEQQVAAGVRPMILLSQFGTAREATLSLIRDLPDEQWDATYQTPRGEMTLREYVKGLVDLDREEIQAIDSKMSKASV